MAKVTLECANCGAMVEVNKRDVSRATCPECGQSVAAPDKETAQNIRRLVREFTQLVTRRDRERAQITKDFQEQQQSLDRTWKAKNSEFQQTEAKLEADHRIQKSQIEERFSKEREEVDLLFAGITQNKDWAKKDLSEHYPSVLEKAKARSSESRKTDSDLHAIKENLKKIKSETLNLYAGDNNIHDLCKPKGCIAGFFNVVALILIMVIGAVFVLLGLEAIEKGDGVGIILMGIGIGMLIAPILINFKKYSRLVPLYSKLSSLTIEAESLHVSAYKMLDDACKKECAAIGENYQKSLKEFRERFAEGNSHYQAEARTIAQARDKKLERLQQDFESGSRAAMTAAADLARAFPPEYRFAASGADVPAAIRVGTLKKTIGDEREHLQIPAALEFPLTGAVLFEGGAASKTSVAQAVEALLFRLLLALPPAKLRFTFLDPVALGQNVAPFMHLADYDDALITSKAWTNRQHIEQRLAELTEHMENVIQKYLRNTYRTIADYNEQAGEIAEPYRFLVIFDFPVNFTEDAARHLVSIIQNGPRCGVYTIIFYDSKQTLPQNFHLNDIEQAATKFAWNGSSFVWQDSDFRECALTFDAPPRSEQAVSQIIETVGKAVIDANKVEVPFEKVLEKTGLNDGNMWKGSSADGLQIPLGPIGANKVQYLEFGKGMAQHALIAGKTGSGKSTLLHVLISTLALKYSPEEVELYLIDFKKGVEFKIYAMHQLPHARVIAIESEREFGLSVLEGLDAELKRRGDLCRSHGVDSVSAYRKATRQPMPRILAVVDEFQEFFTEDDSLATKASQILDRLVRQGRAFGIHILLGSQTLAGAYSLARSTIDQMAIRIALQCSEADSRLILSDDNTAARLLSRPGEAIYNAENGLVEGNNPFQVAWLSDEQQAQYLNLIVERARSNKMFPPNAQIVFEGNAPAHPSNNRAFEQFLRTPRAASVKKASAWLGEPIAIKEPTAAHFQRQPGSNLLIVGQNEEAALGMFATSILSLSAQYAPEAAQFYLLDFSSADAAHAHILKDISDMLPSRVNFGKRRQLPEFLESIAQTVETRLDHHDESLAGQPAIYLMIYGMQRARDFEKDDGFGGSLSSLGSFGGSEGSTPPSPNLGKLFANILREGPDVGVHTMIWCDTNANLQRRLDRQSLKEFDLRVVFQMSNDDSLFLIDSGLASKLGQHRALLHSEEDGRLEKFRPFALPSEQWLRQVGEQFSV